MKERNASRTALFVAAYRARASRRAQPLISDPWAAGLAGAEGDDLARKVDEFLPDRELWIAVRTAYLDDEVRRFLRDGGTQVVILGAGFDTRAARLATAGARFFEVDHPATQADKLARLNAAPGYPVEAATYVPCDFAADDFVETLGRAGLAATMPALFVWEGVTPYLPEPAIRQTLRRVATGFDPRTVLLFDHFTKRFVEGQSSSESDEKSRGFVAALGERFVFGTNDPLPMLYEEGFRHVRSASFDEICLSLTGTYDRARQFRFQRIVRASVTPDAVLT